MLIERYYVHEAEERFCCFKYSIIDRTIEDKKHNIVVKVIDKKQCEWVCEMMNDQSDSIRVED